jgi:hypothetical protein
MQTQTNSLTIAHEHHSLKIRDMERRASQMTALLEQWFGRGHGNPFRMDDRASVKRIESSGDVR